MTLLLWSRFLVLAMFFVVAMWLVWAAAAGRE
jgi:hypothetical protein